MNLLLDLVPLNRVGPFKFSCTVNEYLYLPIYEIPEEYDKDAPYGDWKVYSLEGKDIRIYLEDNKITSIACYDECIYKNINLIGVSLMEFKQQFKLEPNQSEEMDLDDGIQEVYDFDSIALQVYIKKGKIVCETAGSSYEEYNN